jgi:hypothetical protein
MISPFSRPARLRAGHCRSGTRQVGRTSRIGVFASVFCASLVAIAGCSRSNTVRVEGIVTLDGAPLSGATISFVPVDEGGGHHLASGVTNADGRFRLTTFNTNDGAVPGHYRVTVSQVEWTSHAERDASLADEHPQIRIMDRNRNKAPDAHQKLAVEKKKTQHSKVPAVYGDPKKSPLQWEVPPRGDVRLELESKVR